VLGVVVDLAVIDKMRRAVFVRHRLMTARHIHDGETAMAEADVTVNEQATIVRAAMGQHVAHPFERGSLDCAPAVCRQSYAVDTAHKEVASYQLVG
jgi:hypothetical protein